MSLNSRVSMMNRAIGQRSQRREDAEEAIASKRINYKPRQRRGEPYLVRDRLSEVCFLIQILSQQANGAIDPIEVPILPKSAASWPELAAEHMELFRKTERGKIALVAYYRNSRRLAASKTESYSPPPIESLISIAMELWGLAADREDKRAEAEAKMEQDVRERDSNRWERRALLLTLAVTLIVPVIEKLLS